MKLKVLFVALLICLTGCSRTNNQNTDDFNIVTSFYPIYVFTKNITRDIPGVTVTNMSSNHDGCLHDYSLTTTDMKSLSNADAFIINGAGLEEFLEKAYEANPSINIIDSSENIKLSQICSLSFPLLFFISFMFSLESIILILGLAS